MTFESFRSPVGRWRSHTTVELGHWVMDDLPPIDGWVDRIFNAALAEWLNENTPDWEFNNGGSVYSRHGPRELRFAKPADAILFRMVWDDMVPKDPPF